MGCYFGSTDTSPIDTNYCMTTERTWFASLAESQAHFQLELDSAKKEFVTNSFWTEFLGAVKMLRICGGFGIMSKLVVVDVVLVASSAHDLQPLLHQFAAECEADLIKISVSKFETIFLSRNKVEYLFCIRKGVLS